MDGPPGDPAVPPFDAPPILPAVSEFEPAASAIPPVRRVSDSARHVPPAKASLEVRPMSTLRIIRRRCKGNANFTRQSFARTYVTNSPRRIGHLCEDDHRRRFGPTNARASSPLAASVIRERRNGFEFR